MDRVPAGGYSALIEATFNIIPTGMHGFLYTHYLCGVDPIFAGLHRFEDTDDGRSYRDIAQVVHPHHQPHMPISNRHTTLVLPQMTSVSVVVHELGHVLHSRLGWHLIAQPVSEYSKDNKFEAFAEAFTSWLLPGYGRRVDAATAHLFGSLAER